MQILEPGPNNFIELGDVPHSYSTFGTDLVEVNATETGLDFTPTTSLSSLYLKLDQTTPQTVINGAPTFSLGLITPKIYPTADSTTAVQFNKADGTTNVLNVDTLNSRVGVGGTPFENSFEVIGGNISEYNTGVLGSELLTNGAFSAVGTTAATIDATADTIRRTDFQNHKLNNNDRVHFSGTLPAAINNATLYFVVNSTSGNFQISTTQGGAPIDFATAGSSVFFAGDWQVTNDATWDFSNHHIDFAYSTGLASTLKQYLRFRALSSWSNWYSFTYTITNSAGSPTATITTDFALIATALDTTNGTHTTLIRSNTAPGDFTISSTLTAGQAFTIDGVSLKPATGVIASASKMGVGVLDPLYPMDIAGALNLRRDGTPDLSATTTITDSFTLETDVDALNPSSSALYIYPTENYQGRVYFGKSGKAISRINFSNVTTGFESYPYFFFNSGSTVDTFYSNGVRKVFIMAVQSTADIALMTGLDQTYANAGFLTGGQNDAHVGTQIRWKSYAADADTKSPTATYSYDTASSNNTIPHTLWQRAGSTLLTLGANGGLIFKAGTATAGTAPIKLTSGTLLTAAEAGAVEFLTDDFYATITTGAARKGIVLNDGTNLTSGRVPFATTNGRLTDDADLTFATDTLTATKVASTNFKTSSGTTTLYDNFIYGSMYADDVTLTVTVGATATYYAVGTGLLDGGQNGFTYTASGSTLTAATAGKYLATWSMSLQCTAANQEVSGAIMINTTAQMQTEGAVKLTTGSDNKCVSGSGIITLAANDVVKMSVENETAANNIVVTHCTLTLLRVNA